MVVGDSGNEARGALPDGETEAVVREGVMAGRLEGVPEKTLQEARFVIGDFISCAVFPPGPDGSVAPVHAGKGAGARGGRGESGGRGGYGFGGENGGFRGRGRGGFGGGFNGAGRVGDGGLPQGEWRRGERVPEGRGGGYGRGRGRGY